MRNYQPSYSTYSVTDVTRPSCDGIGNPSTYSGEYLSGEKARANVVQGDGINAEKYSAYQWTCKPKEARYRKRIGGWVYCGGGEWSYGYRNTEGRHAPSITTLQLGNAPNRFPKVSNNTIGRAENRCLSDIASKKVDLGQAFAEVVVNAGELQDIAKRLARIVIAVRRKQWGRVNSLIAAKGGKLSGARTAADWYLTWQFGIAPIMSDAYNLSEAIKDALNRPDAFISARGTATNDMRATKVGRYAYKGTILEGAQVGVLYKISDNSIPKLNSLGLANPLHTAWAVAPLSFVVDWILDIGSFLEGLSATIGMTFKSGYTTTFVKTNAEVIDTGISDLYYEIDVPPSWDLREFGMRRTILSGFPFPNVTYKFDLGLGQMTTLLAMLTSGRVR